MPPRPDTTFPIDTDPAFALHSDPDQTTVDVEVDLPLPAMEGTGTAALRAGLIDEMVYDTLVRRLDGDVSAGTAPFDDILPGTNTFVDTIDAPALYAITSADRVDAALDALLEEYERAARFGFTAAEVATATAALQRRFDTLLDGRNTVQDVALADSYVAHFLTGEPYADIVDLHAIASAELAAIGPDAMWRRFLARWTNSAPHVIISTPASQADEMPTEDEVLAAIAALDTRDVTARTSARELPDSLMTPPDPVEPTSERSLLSTGDPFYDPVEIVFPNGVRVIATSNSIVDGQIAFRASSPGGSSLVDDADVIDSLYAADIVTASGVGEFNQTELEQILANRDVELAAGITPYTDEMGGGVASTDLEVLLQLVHLYMTQPRFDPVALVQVERFVGSVVADPGSEPDLAGFDALTELRYGGEPRYDQIPTPDAFATLDLDGVERVWRDRFGDAGDWVFVFAGDVDLDELTDLASRYLGTLPGTAITEQWVDVSPAPPTGVVESTVTAGTGDTASVILLFTSEIGGVDGSLRATADVVNEVLSTRLTDVVRERLGETYSPQAFTLIGNDPTPVIETYVLVTGAPDRVGAVGDLVVGELADLAANGPTEREFAGAFAQVQESYNFVNNEGFLEELITSAIWPGRSLDEYFDEFDALRFGDARSVQATSPSTSRPASTSRSSSPPADPTRRTGQVPERRASTGSMRAARIDG
jgi:zinc protease